MSQQQFFPDEAALTPNIEFVQGNVGAPVGPDPANHTLQIVALDSTVNNDNGIYTDTGAVAFTEQIILTNRFQDTTTTMDATPTGLQLILPNIDGTYLFTCFVTAYMQISDTNLTPRGATFTLTGSVRSTSDATTLINTTDKIANIEGTPSTWDATLAVAALNSIDVTVTGVAAETIKWNVLCNFVFVDGT